MQTLRELIELGFAPMIALVVAAIVVLWLALCGVVGTMYYQFVKDRTERDKIRTEQLTEINVRLGASEGKHEECDKDREKLHQEMGVITYRLGRFESCPRAGCPMRLP